MTGLNGQRVYLDWNATAPLRPEARDAMLQAMDVVGNPSSVHGEGRAAKTVVEKARAQVAALVGCAPDGIVFTGSATEAAALACHGRTMACTDLEHDAVVAHRTSKVDVSGDGVPDLGVVNTDVLAMQAANSEMGLLQDNATWAATARAAGALVLVDAVHAAGKIRFNLDVLGADMLLISAHKIGGAKGIGALCLASGVDVSAVVPGGGQEQGRRSGTENIPGIAAFGAAAAAAMADHEAGIWDGLYELRNLLEERIACAAPDTIFCARNNPRSPNTSCFAMPGWRGETQVMQMDLAGFAVSAGSACSSGKVNKASRVLLAMGFDEETASSAIRVSMGPTTTEAEVATFADAWIDAYRRREARAA
ncbi:MAG: cysteine desulfurase family protein [Pseudomonadota bacterium]